MLEGSGEKISKVVLVKLRRIKDSETELKAGFVEMWEHVDGIAKKEGERLVSSCYLSSARFMLIS